MQMSAKSTDVLLAAGRNTQFSKDEERLARYAKALAHPARIAILKQVAFCGACICADIVDILPFAQSTVSQHLQALVEAGIIRRTSDGPRSCYSINWDAVESFGRLFSAFLDDVAWAGPTKSHNAVRPACLKDHRS